MRNLHVGPIARSLLRHRALFALVVLELASGFTIISCLILAATWYFKTGHKPTGHREDDLVAVSWFVPAASADAAVAQRAASAAAAAERAQIAALPDVEALTMVSGSSIDERWTFPSSASRRPPGVRRADDETYAMIAAVDPAASTVLGFRWLEGAMPDSPAIDVRQVVITQLLRERLFGQGAGLGQRFWLDRLGEVEVVGVVANVMMSISLLPHAQSVAFELGRPADERERRYLVRARPGRGAAVVAALTAALGPSRPDRLVEVAAFDRRASRAHEISSGLVAFLAAIGGVVGIIALSGAVSVASFLVVERRRQIGIRRALGATRGDVVRYFLVESTLATALGTGLGLLATSLLFLAMRRVFLELQLSWWMLFGSAVLLWLDATLAAMVPALRGADVPPSVASRGL